MRHIINKSTALIPLGRRGENLAREIAFEVPTAWGENYGPGEVHLVAQRPGETDPYPVTISLEDGTAVWRVTSADTAKEGHGRCELRYMVGDVIAKSAAWHTVVATSLSDDLTEPPEPQQSWVDRVLTAGATAEAAAKRAEDAAVRQPRPDPETGTWWAWDAETGAYVDTGESCGTSEAPVKTVNDLEPDENGNVEIPLASSSAPGVVYAQTQSDAYCNPVYINEYGYLHVPADIVGITYMQFLYNACGHCAAIVSNKGTSDIDIAYPAFVVFGGQTYGNFDITVYANDGAVYSGTVYASGRGISLTQKAAALPPATADDNGKIPIVQEDGSYVLGNYGVGDSCYGIPILLEQGNAILNGSADFKSVFELVGSGTLVYLYESSSLPATYFFIRRVYSDYMEFDGSNGQDTITITWHSSDENILAISFRHELPTPSSTDEGLVPIAQSNGQYQLQSLIINNITGLEAALAAKAATEDIVVKKLNTLDDLKTDANKPVFVIMGKGTFGTELGLFERDFPALAFLSDVATGNRQGFTLHMNDGNVWGGVLSPSGIVSMTESDSVQDGDIGLGITGAAVGQIARITAVDDEGKPTAWEPVDLPDGDGWELITDTTIAEEDAAVTLFINKKDSGEAFSFRELAISWIGIAVTDGTASGKAWISLNPTVAGYNKGKLGWATNSYFYYTSIADYPGGVIVETKPRTIIKIDSGTAQSISDIADEVYQNGVSSVEVSAYGSKSFYGRVIIYGR